MQDLINRLNEGGARDCCSQRTEAADAIEKLEADLVQHRELLVTYLSVIDPLRVANALDGAFISSWQSTAAWKKELDAAREYLKDQHHD